MASHRSPELDLYASPGRFTDLAGAGDIGFASADVETVVDAVQGLLVYDLVASDLYGVDLPAEQAETIHERDAGRLLAAALAVDPSPIGQARPPERRVGGRCHQFTRLTVALLRAAGVPARSRCGFGGAFLPGWWEDHWVAEYWDAERGRWAMVDAQLDQTWRDLIAFGGDRFDLTPAEFLTAGHAWQAWRRGDLDAGRCGLSSISEHGAHWIAGNLRLDLAALNKVEMLPWDVWGAGFEPGEEPSDELLALFDAVADLTVDPDANLDQLRNRYDTDEGLRMDGTVFSVLRGELETV